MTAHSFVMGSLLVTRDVLSALPADVNPQYLPGQIKRAHPELGSLYYIDNWPNIAPILMVISPSAAFQATQEHSLPKFPWLATLPASDRGERPAGEHGRPALEDMEAYLQSRVQRRSSFILDPGLGEGHQRFL
jgi:hypothetical protein